jgi:hypothetical protein
MRQTSGFFGRRAAVNLPDDTHSFQWMSLKLARIVGSELELSEHFVSHRAPADRGNMIDRSAAQFKMQISSHRCQRGRIGYRTNALSGRVYLVLKTSVPGASSSDTGKLRPEPK